MIKRIVSTSFGQAHSGGARFCVPRTRGSASLQKSAKLEGHASACPGLFKMLVSLLAFAGFTAIGYADLRVVATVPNMGMLAREIGGEAVEVRVMAPPNRDAHFLEARPSMMAALRRADLVVAVGAELEIGWLPAAIQGANNRRVQPGQPGYFEAAQAVELIGVGKPADRALGDVHPSGNPHFYMDPERLVEAGYALAQRLGSLELEKADYFQDNAERLEERVAQRMPEWREKTVGAPGVLLYHEDADYLLIRLDVPLLGYIEPLPGIPPTARHLRTLVSELEGREGIIWTMEYQPADGGRFLSRELDWPAVQLPSQVSMEGDLDEYFEMIDNWVNSLTATE